MLMPWRSAAAMGRETTEQLEQILILARLTLSQLQAVKSLADQFLGRVRELKEGATPKS